MTVQELLVRNADGDVTDVDDADLMPDQYAHWTGVKERVYITGNY